MRGLSQCVEDSVGQRLPVRWNVEVTETIKDKNCVKADFYSVKSVNLVGSIVSVGELSSL